MNLNIIIPILVIAFMFILNIPIWYALVAGVLPYFMFLNHDMPVHIVAQRMIAVMESQSFLAIPFFVTAGSIMNYSGISSRLVNLADGLVGHLRGGLGQVNVVLSALNGGVSGSAAADAAMDCKILVPEMVKKGYSKEFSAAVTLASSLITPIIPPGMGLIVYAFVANVSVGRMFVGGYIPGILTTILLMIVVDIISKRNHYVPSRKKMASIGELLKLFLRAIWALLMPFGLILALRIGVFTASEAGAFCAFYALFVGVFVYREIKWKHVWPILKESVLGTATIIIIVCSANALSFFMTYERVPHQMTQALINMDLNRYTFLLLVNLLFLFIGMFMEGGAPLLILTPLLAPIAASLGIDLIHFGLVIVFNIGIGNMSPPFGLVLFQVGGLLGIRTTTLTKASFPFLLVMLFVLLLITYIPEIVLFLPRIVYGA
jgi:tripartite ATP-independent transporter DctM subunit